MTFPWLEGPLATAAYGWRLERADGVTIGFTSHDRDVVFDGLIYRASPGMAPSSIVEMLGLEIGSLEVSGALTSDALRAEDIEAGRWDGALLVIFLFDWNDLAAAPFVLAMGTLGDVTWSGSAFQVEFLGPATGLSNSIVPSTSPTCRAEFGGKGCNLNRRRFIKEVRVLSNSGAVLALDAPGLSNPSDFAFGEIRWLSGPGCGLRQKILSATQSMIILAEEPVAPVSAPATVALLQGCDRTIATCAARFANAANFRGEPYLPGNDLLTRYPGAM